MPPRIADQAKSAKEAPHVQPPKPHRRFHPHPQPNATNINNHNLIVGYAFGDDGDGNFIQKAFIDQDGQMTDLWSHIPHKTGWEELDSADDVNDQGQIAGWGIYNGQVQAFLITIPEPAALLPLALAIGLLARTRKKRRRSLLALN